MTDRNSVLAVTVRLVVWIVSMSVVAACAFPGDREAPSGSSELGAELIADAAARACVDECEVLDVYIRDELTTLGNAVETEPMPDTVREALGRELGNVEFVDLERIDALFIDGLVDGGQGVLITVGPIKQLARDVVGVDVLVTTARDGAYGQTVQYLWRDDGWQHATSDETGVPVTSSVS